jgi:hypothetical protein
MEISVSEEFSYCVLRVKEWFFCPNDEKCTKEVSE